MGKSGSMRRTESRGRRRFLRSRIKSRAARAPTTKAPPTAPPMMAPIGTEAALWGSAVGDEDSADEVGRVEEGEAVSDEEDGGGVEEESDVVVVVSLLSVVVSLVVVVGVAEEDNEEEGGGFELDDEGSLEADEAEDDDDDGGLEVGADEEERGRDVALDVGELVVWRRKCSALTPVVNGDPWNP